MAITLQPFPGLAALAKSIRPIINCDWSSFAAKPGHFQEGMRRFEEALRNAEALGRVGWTIPLNADLAACIRLLGQLHTPESADAAFLDFYTQDENTALVELIADLQRQPKLGEFREVLDEVWFAIDARKYRLAVPALLTVFEGTARRCWQDGVWRGDQLKEYLDAKLAAVDPDLFDYAAWTATRVFVRSLYASNRGEDPKPPLLNRHWIMHGKGPADGRLADCLRLLQAIHTVVLLSDDAEAAR